MHSPSSEKRPAFASAARRHCNLTSHGASPVERLTVVKALTCSVDHDRQVIVKCEYILYIYMYVYLYITVDRIRKRETTA